MDVETQIIVIASVFSAAWLILLVISLVLCCQVSSLRRKLNDANGTARIRVQKLKMDDDKNHAFHNPAISPDEELSKRGYSMYVANEDVESGRGTERQTGGQFVEELARELESRQQRQSAPPFLLNSIEDNKRKSRNLANPVAHDHYNSNGRQSETNPNFIY